MCIISSEPPFHLETLNSPPNFVNKAYEFGSMQNRNEAIPIEALEDIEYLSRSPNRVKILDTLTNGPYSRRNLADLTDVSRTTLDRIVNELEERGWVQRTNNGNYVGTPVGTHLMAQVRPFIDSVQAIRRLDEAVAWIPTDELSIGLHHFSDASVLRPEQDDPMETVDYFTDLIRETTEFRVLTHLAPPGPLARAMRDRIISGELNAEYVVTNELIEYLYDQPERRERWRDILNGGGTLVRIQGPIPCNLWIFDDNVLIKKSGPEPIEDSYGVPILSTNETVRSWAHNLVDTQQANATHVNIEIFEDESAVG